MRQRVNRRATLFWWLHMPPAREHDVLAGDVVLVGPTDSRGLTQDVPELIQQLLCTHSAVRVEIKVTGSESWMQNDLLFEDYFDAIGHGLSLARRWSQVELVRVVTAS